jgi:hypothetical protein
MIRDCPSRKDKNSQMYETFPSASLGALKWKHDALSVRFRLCMSMEWMTKRRLAVHCTRCLRHAYLQCA